MKMALPPKIFQHLSGGPAVVNSIPFACTGGASAQWIFLQTVNIASQQGLMALALSGIPAAPCCRNCTMSADLDENGKIVFWDIRSGKQTEEILFQDWERAERLSEIKTLPGKPKKLRVQGNRLFAYGLNALYVYGLKEKAKRLEFIGESEECLKTRGKRPRSIPTYDRPDDCRDIIKPGQLSRESKHYAFLARFEGIRSKWGELTIADWSRPETKQYYLYTSSNLLDVFAGPSDIIYNDTDRILGIVAPMHCYRFIFSGAKDDNTLPAPQKWDNPEAAPSEQDRSRYALHWLSPSADTVIWRNHRNELVRTILENGQDETLFRLKDGPGVYRRLWVDEDAGDCVLEKAIADGEMPLNNFEVYDLRTGKLEFLREFKGDAHHLLTFNRDFLVTRRATMTSGWLFKTAWTKHSPTWGRGGKRSRTK